VVNDVEKWRSEREDELSRAWQRDEFRSAEKLLPGGLRTWQGHTPPFPFPQS